uniref:Uncharacterized protein n=1 Tax=Salix viminalis TaxID=40686 RepID=A0A6N2MQM4_SALVM
MVTANNNSSSSTVQHVTKKSSDELLRKFAETSDGAKKLELANGVKKEEDKKGSWNPSYYKSSSSLAERRSLLPPAPTRKSLLLRQLGIGRLQLKARDAKNRSILASIDKTWRKTVEGASKVFLEKHYNRHRRLINDMI